MSSSLFDQLRARGEGFLSEISNNLMANPTFLEFLKKGIAAKDEIDKRVAEGLKAMSVATHKDIANLERRLAELEERIGELKSKPAARAAKPAPKARPRKAAARKR